MSARSIERIRTLGAQVFRTKWLNDNRVIGVVFSVLLVLNAWALASGYYR